MGNVYTPNGWAIIKAGDEFWVLGAWTGGGPLGADSWRRNSGITGYEHTKDGEIKFFGNSDSTYVCHEEDEHHMSNFCRFVLADIIDKWPGGAEIVKFKTFLEEF